MPLPTRTLSAHPACRHGFSLIETLVALSVLALLVAVLLFSVQGARDKGSMAKSLSILRQYQTANNLYALDNDGQFIPIRRIDPETEKIKRWLDYQPYRELLEIPSGAEWPQDLISPNTGVLDDEGNRKYNRSYAMNTLGLSGWFDAEVPYQVNMASFEDPANTIAFIDALDWVTGPWGTTRYTGEEINDNKHAIAYRYGGKATMVFYDGHTGAYTMDEMLQHKQEWWSLVK